MSIIGNIVTCRECGTILSEITLESMAYCDYDDWGDLDLCEQCEDYSNQWSEQWSYQNRVDRILWERMQPFEERLEIVKGRIAYRNRPDARTARTWAKMFARSCKKGSFFSYRFDEEKKRALGDYISRGIVG